MSTLHQVSHLSCQILHGGVHWLIYIRIIPGKGIVEIGATDGTQKIYRQSFTWEKFKEAFGNKITDDQIVAKVRCENRIYLVSLLPTRMQEVYYTGGGPEKRVRLFFMRNSRRRRAK